MSSRNRNNPLAITGRPVVLAVVFCLLAAGIAPAGVWKFAVIGDSRGDGAITSTAWVNTNVLRAAAHGITNERPDFVLFTGDMIYGSNAPACTNLPAQYAAWSNALAPVYSAGIPVYPIRGNHETYGDPDGGFYASAFGSSLPHNGPAGETGKTYSFIHNNALIIGLDQYRNAHRVNQDWLNAQLSSNSLPHIFVFGHEPAVQVNHADCLAREKQARDLFLESIAAAGGRMYFCGHDHFYNRARLAPSDGIGNIMQIVAGTGGGPFHTWDGIYGKNYGEQNLASNCYYSAYTNGYVLVTVSNFNVHLEWKGSTNLAVWETCDEFGYQVTNPAVRNVNDYDGDSLADPAIYSENDARMLFTRSSEDYRAYAFNLGGPGAMIAPGDYDGDGKADPAVYWKTNGLWQIPLSDQNYAIITDILGGAGYLPVPADYDGDGKTDISVFKRSSGHWQALFSGTGELLAGSWSGAGWNPVPADYDGDGRADLAVYRQSSGEWQTLLSAGLPLGHYAFYAFNWGGPGCFAVPADYDNDGWSDPALYTKSSSLFQAMLSAWSYALIGITLDIPDCTPLSGDYDGDGLADPMVYSQAAGQWQCAFSSLDYSMFAFAFGGPGWMAVQNDARHDLIFLAFGDSITYGGGSSSDSPATAYPILLENKLCQNYTGYFQSINAGNPGETTEEGLERFPRWLDANKPDLVLLMEGTNDEFFGDDYDQTEDNLRAMVAMALTRGINVIIATIPPVISNGYRNRDEQQRRIVEFNPRIYRIAADYNIPVAQVYESITAVPGWQNSLMDQPSANHPNDAGHAVIRDAFYAPVAAGLDAGEY
ncbi:MAG: GDSL-type esterase/lipase family protein [Kiritimatiellae bacterium]|nr:GDSL-type esterase/lipase family protein [Kiritimatiellia bacterium]